MKKKILFLIPQPPPVHGASLIGYHIKNSVKINNKFQSFYINTHTSKELEDISKWQFYKIFEIFKIVFLCFYKMLIKNPDIVMFAPAPIGLGLYKDALLLFIIKLFRKKIILHFHGKGIRKQVVKSKFKKILFKYMLKNSNLICLSENLINDISLVRDKSKLLKIINNFSKNVNLKKKKRSKNLTFVFLSNLIISKGILIFIDSIKVLQKNKKISNFNVKIIGKAPDENTLKLVENKISKLKNVNYLGPIFGKKKFIELNKADVLVFPTKFPNETYPLVVLESMSLGLAAISTREGAVPDMIENNQHGFILKKCNANECAHYMLKYIKDKKLAYTHGKNAKLKYSKRYTFKIFEKSISNFLDEVLLAN